jgi:hypothetical protein
MEDIMDTVHVTSKGQMMDILEKFYIFWETKLNNQINDKLTIKPDIIFDTVVHYGHYRRLPDSHTQCRQQPVLQDRQSSSQWYKLLQNLCQAIHLCHQGLHKSIQRYIIKILLTQVQASELKPLHTQVTKQKQHIFCTIEIHRPLIILCPYPILQRST